MKVNIYWERAQATEDKVTKDRAVLMWESTCLCWIGEEDQLHHRK